ncbi:MAG: hypothetical protein F6K65_25745 [Moorea sp. SIO3C2]|nr:hypothetical protein [Moorena sp. SIO3C2]
MATLREQLSAYGLQMGRCVSQKMNRSRAGILPARKDQGTGNMPILQVRPLMANAPRVTYGQGIGSNHGKRSYP